MSREWATLALTVIEFEKHDVLAVSVVLVAPDTVVVHVELGSEASDMVNHGTSLVSPLGLFAEIVR